MSAAEIAALLGTFIATWVSATFAPVLTFALFLLVIFLRGMPTSLAPMPINGFECTPASSWFHCRQPPERSMLRQYVSTHYRLAGSIALLSTFSVGCGCTK